MMKYKSIHSDIWLASRYSNNTQINGQDNTYHNSGKMPGRYNPGMQLLPIYSLA